MYILKNIVYFIAEQFSSKYRMRIMINNELERRMNPIEFTC